MVEKEIIIEIKKPELLTMLFILFIIFVGFPPFVNIFYHLPSRFQALEIPGMLYVSLTSPINFGDEGFHTRFAQWVAENREYPVNTPFEGTKLIIGGNWQPPLWQILEGSFLFIFGFHEFIVKFLTPFIAVMTGLAIFLIVKRLYNEKVAFMAAVISITIPSYVTYSVLYYRDIAFVFYLVLFFLTFILSLKTEDKKYWILSAVFGSFAFLAKTPGLVTPLFVVIMFLYQLITEKKFHDLFNKYLIFGSVMLLITGTYFLRNFYYYGTPLCTLQLPFFKNTRCYIDNFNEKYEFAGRTEQIGTEQTLFSMGLTNYLDFAYGPRWFVTLGSICGLFILLIRKTKTDLIILIILLLSLPILFRSTQRAEDTARYLLGWAPFIALLTSKYFSEIYEFIKNYNKTLALIVFILVIYLSFYNLKGKLLVMKQVKQFSPMFFEACDWIKNNTDEDALIMTVWGHRAVYNCQRNVSAYLADIVLSKDLNYTLSVAEMNGITHIFVQKFSLSDKNLSEKYPIDFVQFLEENSEHFKKVYENGPPLQQCLQQGGCDGNILYEIVY